jgi:hypothetical protein
MDAQQTTPEVDPTNECIPEGTPHPALDAVVRHWLRIAALAWEGVRTEGPGNVIVTFDATDIQIEYWAGSLCDCHPVGPETYDPTTQAVVAARDGETDWPPLVVTGWPTPPEAFAMATNHLMDRTVH